MSGDQRQDAAEPGGDASFRDLFERNPVPMFIYARAGTRILEGNEAAARQYGYTRRAFLSMRLDDLLLPGDRWRLAERHRTPHTGGFAKIGIKRHMRADSSAFYAEVERLDLTFRGVPAALITAIDVTERLLATERLLETQQQLAVAQRLASAGSFERDLRTGTVHWSEETYRIMGRDPALSAPLRDELLAMVHPDDRARYEASMLKSEGGEDPGPVEYRIVSADGRMRRILTFAETVKDDSGRPLKRIGTFQDVTERREAEARREAQELRLKQLTVELRRQQEHLAAAQKISRIGSIDRDLISSEVVWSAEALRLFGFPPGTPAPSRAEFLALFHPEDRERFALYLAAGERGENPAPIECRIVRPNGVVRWVRNAADTVRDESGRLLRRVSTFQDVTEMHEAQERQLELERSLRVAIDAAEEARREVVAANMELEARVEARTAELRAAQMTLVTKERLSALGQLTATVAHEMRNPLSAIRNTIFIMDGVARAHGISLDRPLSRMTRSVARCEDIIADLLDFTRAREPKLAPVVLDDWLGEVLDEQPVPAGITLERSLGAPGLVVPMDGERFRRVVINLIDNAVHAIEGGGGAERRIIVSTSAAPEPEIRIVDFGPGIAPDILPRIFEPLFSTKSFGTGLGLPTVKQIVEQHGGTIVVESEGPGTTVRISLPEHAEALRTRMPFAAA
jgi:PAS domain S-box-containing protein